MTFSSFSTSLSGKETRYSLLFFILVVVVGVRVNNNEEINMSLFTVNTINEVKPKVFCLDGPFFNKLDIKDL